MIMLMLMLMLTTKVWDIMSAIALSQWSTTIGTPRLVLLIIANIICLIIIILDTIASPSPDRQSLEQF